MYPFPISSLSRASNFFFFLASVFFLILSLISASRFKSILPHESVAIFLYYPFKLLRVPSLFNPFFFCEPLNYSWHCIFLGCLFDLSLSFHVSSYLTTWYPFFLCCTFYFLSTPSFAFFFLLSFRFFHFLINPSLSSTPPSGPGTPSCLAPRPSLTLISA